MDAPHRSDNTWITFHEPSPSSIKARFSVTHIEVPSSKTENITDDLLRLLIDEGVPVKVVPELAEGKATHRKKKVSNAGFLFYNPTLAVAEQQDGTPFVDRRDGDRSSAGDVSNRILSNRTAAVESAIEVLCDNRSISSPLYLHYALAINDSDGTDSDQQRVLSARSISTDLLKECPIIPWEIAEELCQPSKKRVMFTLPAMAASIVGVYEQFPLAEPMQSDTRNLGIDDAKMQNPHMLPIEDIAEYHDDISLNQLENLDGYDMACENDPLTTQDDEADPNKGSSSSERSNSCSCSGTCTCYDDDDLENDSGINLDEPFTMRTIAQSQDRCGCCNWSPHWLQRFACPQIYLLVYCIVSLVHGMLYSYTNSVISTLKRRFHLKSSDVGLLLIGNDISQVLCLIVISFYGANSHRPRWMGIATVICSAGAFLSAVPHFFFGVGGFARDTKASNSSISEITNAGIELCQVPTPTDCNLMEASEEQYYDVMFFLFTSQFLIGVASSIFWALGVSYLDDFVPKRKTPLYFAAFSIIRVVGPTLGYLFGVYCLSYYVDITADENFRSWDRRWIGAWWLGFIVLSMIVLITGIFYFCFPKQLPTRRTTTLHLNREDECVDNFLTAQFPPGGLSASNTNLGAYSTTNSRFLNFPSLKKLPPSLKRLFTNRIWMANLVSNTMFVLAFGGYWKFKPKYIENQFRKSPSVATFYTGLVTMVASVVGIGISGVVLSYYRPRAKYVTAYNVFLSTFAFLSLFIVMELKCKPVEFAGHLPNQDPWACSSHCTCSEMFDPVCADDGITNFYSPCYAGCAEAVAIIKPPYGFKMVYTNCSCIRRVKWVPRPDQFDEVGDELMDPYMVEGWALQGFCPNDQCSAFYIFLGLHVFIRMTFTTGRISGILINIRSVEQRDKAMALGSMTCFIILFGFLPSTWFMSAVIDSACLVWYHKCNSPDYCSFYDNKKLRILMHIVPAGLLIFAVLGDIVVYLNHAKMDLFGEGPYRKEPKSFKMKSKPNEDQPEESNIIQF